jgi:hypothetical protein
VVPERKSDRNEGGGVSDSEQQHADWRLACNLSDAELAGELALARRAYLRGEDGELDEDFMATLSAQASLRWLSNYEATGTPLARIETALARGVAVCGNGVVYHLRRCAAVENAVRLRIPGWGPLTSFFTNDGRKRRLCQYCEQIVREEDA